MRIHLRIVVLVGLVVGASACDERSGSDTIAAGSASDERHALEAGTGVDPASRTIHVGALDAETGPAAAVGLPMAIGRRMLVERVNREGGLLPGDWTIELHERDHGYDAEKAGEAYESFREDVLFIATSVGAEPTFELRKRFERDGIVAFPASLSRKMARHPYTPPVGPGYRLQGSRAATFVASRSADDADTTLGLLYQDDSYGRDVLEGVERTAEARDDLRIATRQSLPAGTTEVDGPLDALRSESVDGVVLAVLPATTAAVLRSARTRDLTPTWVAATPAWSDQFFTDDPPAPPAAFEQFYRIGAFPFWGEDVPGMETFTATYDEYGADAFRPDHYILRSYIQGLIQLEALRRCFDRNRLTRKSFLEALHSIQGWNAGGLTPDIDLSGPPYRSMRRTRVLAPDFETGSWTVAGDYRRPSPN